MARRVTQPNARYVTPATTGEIFGQMRGAGTQQPRAPKAPAHTRGPGRPGGPGGPGGPRGRVPVAPSRQSKRFVDYPRFGRQGWRRWIPSWRLVAAVNGILFLTMIVAFFTAYAATDMPTEDSLAKAQTTVVTYGDGKTELGRLAVQNRRNVTLEQVPDHVEDAFISAEDRTFRDNNGVNPTSIIRAAWANARGKPLQGGSTITQQYVKNYFDLKDRTLSRKAKEFFIALKIDREMDKNQILTDYLNTIYFGRGAYGVEAASQAYFGKSVSKLDVSEGAFLAGILNAPSTYDPADGEEAVERGTRRWNYVLDGLVEMQKLSAADRGKAVWPKFKAPRKTASLGGQNGYLMQMAKAEAAREMGIRPDQLETGGYKIVTTFRKPMIDDAAQAVKEMLPKKRPAGLQVGMAAIDPGSGQVWAIYGGEDYLKRQQNAATQDRAQAGSTFKPFGLVAALEKGISLRSRFSGRNNMEFDDADRPIKNFGGSSFGMINLMRATANSVNTVYVQLNEEVGPEKTKDVAVRAGIPDDKATNVDDNLVNVLGSASPHPLDMASAYATFANDGVRFKPYTVVSVTDATGKEMYRAKPPPKRAFDKEVMADLTHALEQVVKGGSGSYARNLGRPAAGKTGTSTDNRSAWFVGYTPQLATAVAMYQNDEAGNPVELDGFGQFSAITGATYPVRIWTEFMKAAHQGWDREQFPDPVFGGEVRNPEPVVTRQPDPEPTPDQPTTRPTETETDDDEPDPPTETETEPTRTKPTTSFTLPTGPPPGNGNGNGRGRGDGRGGNG